MFEVLQTQANKLIEARDREKQLVSNAIRDLKAYLLAMNYGEHPATGIQFANACESISVLFGSDEIAALAGEARGPIEGDRDFFDNAMGSLRSLAESIRYEDARS